MNRYRILLVCVALVAGVGGVSAQPQVEDAPAAAGAQEGTMGAFGNGKPFSLLVDQVDGEMEFNYNEETKELESITAKKGVILSSEEMTLNADQLDYDTVSSKLIATGQRVVVRQGDVIATCQKFLYNPTTQASELHGTPVVYNRGKDGQVTKVSGGIIKIYQQNGRPKWKVLKGSSLQTGGTEVGAGGGTQSSPSGGLNFGMGGGSSAASASDRPAASGAGVSNRIDPSNPTDVQSVSRRSASTSR